MNAIISGIKICNISGQTVKKTLRNSNIKFQFFLLLASSHGKMFIKIMSLIKRHLKCFELRAFCDIDD